MLPSDIAAALERNYVGQQIGMYRENERLIPILARSPADERRGVEDLGNAQVFSATAGKYVPVSQFIERIDTVWEDALIRRENRFPTIKAQCDPPAGQLSAPLRAPAASGSRRPSPCRRATRWNGMASTRPRPRAQCRTRSRFALRLRSDGGGGDRDVQRSAPDRGDLAHRAELAVVGVAVGLLVFQAPFEFMAILGFLSLTGMLIKNAIVLVD